MSYLTDSHIFMRTSSLTLLGVFLCTEGPEKENLPACGILRGPETHMFTQFNADIRTVEEREHNGYQLIMMANHYSDINQKGNLKQHK